MREPPALIAEIGCNHMGRLDLAKEMVDVAGSFCNIDRVKFQKRDIRSILTAEQYAAPHPEPHHAFGASYGEHRERLEFSVEQHRELQNYCSDRGVTYSSSVWDVISMREIASLNPPYLKIPSASNSNPSLLEAAAGEYAGDVHVSLGMTTPAEEERILEVFSRHGRLRSLVLYACTSAYPIQPEDAFLLEITRLIGAYGGEIAGVGYSGHHNGISLDIAAFTLGATYVERHFTLDRTWKGTDQAASLEPDGLRRVRRDLSKAALALRARPSRGTLPVELPQRAKLKWHKDSYSPSSADSG
jgi:sialic acid synthase SpsE